MYADLSHFNIQAIQVMVTLISMLPAYDSDTPNYTLNCRAENFPVSYNVNCMFAYRSASTLSCSRQWHYVTWGRQHILGNSQRMLQTLSLDLSQV